MTLNIRDPETDALVRKLAQSRQIGLTDAIREAVSETLAADERKASLWQRTADIRARVASYPRTGAVADKAFYDSLSGQGDD